MTKEQIIRSISDEFKISELESIQFYENVFQFIEGSFKKSRNLNISEFGKFNIVEKMASDGARINSVKFSPSRKLATEVNYNYNNLAKILFRDIERNMNKERILSLGEENMYRQQSGSESAEVFDRYSEEEKDFIEQQVNFTSASTDYSNSDLSDLEKRVRKVEAFIDVIRRFFEEQKLGAALKEVKKTEVVPPQADYIKRTEEDRIKDEKYKASISALEQKIKDLEQKFKEVESKKTESKAESTPEARTESAPVVKEDKIVLPPIDVIPPVVEKIQDEKVEEQKEVKEPEAKKSIDLGNLVVETDYTEKLDTVTKPIIESVSAPVIEDDIEAKIAERIAEIRKETEAKIVETEQKEVTEPEAKQQEAKEPEVKQPEAKEESRTSSIDDLLKTLSSSDEDVKTAEDKITEEFFVKADEPLARVEAPKKEAEEEKSEAPAEEKIESRTEEKHQEKHEEKSSAPTTNLVGEISDSELHDKVDSIIQEFKTESNRLKDGDEVADAPVEEAKHTDEVIDYSKPAPEQEPEEAQLSMALSSIFNSILQSENINKESSSPVIKEDVKNLHDEIIKTDKPSEPEIKNEANFIEPEDEKKITKDSSISDIYAGAKSFNDVFEETRDKGPDEVQAKETNGHGLKETNGHGLKETNGHGLKETNGHGLKETNGHGLKETNGHGLKDTNGHGLNDTYSNGHSLADDQGRTSKIYTNGNPLKPYHNGNGKNGNGHSTLNQVLEDNGLQKESKSSIFIIGIIILIALALLFFAIFSSGIMGKENNSAKENNYGLVKIKDARSEKYFYDNGKDKVYFQTDKGFTIQADSYKDKQTAIDKRKSLMDKKVENVRIEELENNGETFYRVRIGMFTTLDEAKNYSQKF